MSLIATLIGWAMKLPQSPDPDIAPFHEAFARTALEVDMSTRTGSDVAVRSGPRRTVREAVAELGGVGLWPVLDGRRASDFVGAFAEGA